MSKETLHHKLDRVLAAVAALDARLTRIEEDTATARASAVIQAELATRTPDGGVGEGATLD